MVPCDLRCRSSTPYEAWGLRGGLMLAVKRTGARSWFLRVRVAGRRRDFALGDFPTLPLANARQKARALREKLANGVDPLTEREAIRAALAAA